MTITPPPTPSIPKLLAFSILAFGLSAIYVLRSDSLWIDEGDTAVYAIQPTLSDWWQHLTTDPNADCQMPLTMLVAWLSGKMIGTSEVALRAPNLFWAFLALLTLAIIGRLRNMPWLPLLLAVQPFYAFYCGEARPYAAQIAAGCIVLLALVLFQQHSGRGSLWAWIFGLASILAFSLSVLAPFSLLPAGGVMLILAVWNCWKPSLSILVPAGLAFLICLPLTYYYIGTVMRGAEGAKIWSVGLANVVYAGYELTGLVGLGPPVRLIREAAKSSSLPALFLQYPALIPLCLCLAGGALYLCWSALSDPTARRNLFCHATPALAVFLLACLSFAFLAVFMGKAFWARHLAFVFPFFLYVIACLGHEAAGGAKAKKLLFRLSVSLFALIWLFSSASVRFSPSHGKDDYRTAAHIAVEEIARGKVVWWLASWHCAAYYGLPVDYEGRSTSPRFLLFHSPSRVLDLPFQRPDIALLSKPDIYDSHGVVLRNLTESQFTPKPCSLAFLKYSATK